MAATSSYVNIRHTTYPRLPLTGNIDVTYRCNNNCVHCWLQLPDTKHHKQKELPFDRIIEIVDEARNLGCRQWNISGGEPMLRDDFPELFEYITSRASTYSLNTNGTLITPKIAALMKRKGVKLISIYGASEKVHDRITRTPGSFKAMQQGISYLKEQGARFVFQIVPMKDNFHQMEQMKEFAIRHNVEFRYGASWLYLRSDADLEKNNDIKNQRLDPQQLLKVNPPTDSSNDISTYDVETCLENTKTPLYTACIEEKNSFHIDPYGTMSFCAFVKDPKLRYAISNGSFSDGWDRFMPSLSEKILGTEEYDVNCKSCKNRLDCNWCPAYAYLEHQNHFSKIAYLCTIAKESITYQNDWKKKPSKVFQISRNHN